MKSLIILFLLPAQMFAQDITGLWSGYLYNDTTGNYLPYELVISEDKDKATGYSHILILIKSIENVAIKTMQVKKNNGKILVEDEAYIFSNFSKTAPKGVKVFINAIFSGEADAGVLSGEWNTNSTKEYRALTGTVRLQRQTDLTRSKLIAKLHDLKLSDKLSFLSVKKQDESLAIVSHSVPENKAEFLLLKNDEIDNTPIAVVAKYSSPDLQAKHSENVLSFSKSSLQKSQPVYLPKEITEDIAVIIPAKYSSSDLQPKHIKNVLSFSKSSLQKSKPVYLPKEVVKDIEVVIPAKYSSSGFQPKHVKNVLSFSKSSLQKSKPLHTPKEVAKDISVVIPAKLSSPDLTLKQKEVVLSSTTSSIPKPVVKPQVKPQEKPVIAIAAPKKIEKKVSQVPPAKPKIEQIVATAPPVLIKKPIIPPVEQPKEKEITKVLVPPVKQISVKASATSAVDLAIRKTETIQSVLFKSDSLVLTLYDNGEVDGDTVSVVMNGKLILAHQGLSVNAITKTIYMTPELGDSLQLIMYAENLGSIPPNTGLLILQDGGDRYEIRFAGDFNKNSAIILRRKR